MFRAPFQRPCFAFVLLGFAAWGGMAYARPDAALKLYGPTSPSPAIQDAALAFGARHQVEIEVQGGPVEQWLNRAAVDADLIFASASFMMSQFVRNESLHIDPASVTPLYMRPSVVLVRPGNPHGVLDFPDLLKPGVRILVVNGSGQTGLWEDMAGKLGDIRTVRALRQNIVHYADTSDDAMKTWKERPDIDAWITWNIWYIPLRDQARLIPVSDDYRVYRNCSIALTQRGAAKPLAREFIRFLLSPEGADIFSSWGWMLEPPAGSRLTVHRDICAVCGIDNDASRDGVGVGLLNVRRLLDDYETAGIAPQDVHLCVVLHGDAARWLLTDAAYAAVLGEPGPNPNKELVNELFNLGVIIQICGRTMAERGWKPEDLLPGVEVIDGAFSRIIDLQQQGYGYLQF